MSSADGERQLYRTEKMQRKWAKERYKMIIRHKVRYFGSKMAEEGCLVVLWNRSCA